MKTKNHNVKSPLGFLYFLLASMYGFSEIALLSIPVCKKKDKNQ